MRLVQRVTVEASAARHRFRPYSWRRKGPWLLVGSLALLATFYCRWTGPGCSKPETLKWPAVGWRASADSPPAPLLVLLEGHAERARAAGRAGLDVAEMTRKWGITFRDDTLAQYRARLLDALDTYLVRDPTRRTAHEMAQRAGLEAMLGIGPAEVDSQQIPRRIYTASKSLEDLGPHYGLWAERNPGWEISTFDDEAMRDWVDNVTRVGPATMNKEASPPRVVQGFRGFHKGILKADFFRYLVLFWQGGLYTDSDTAPMQPIRAWPGFLSPDAKVENVMSPPLARIQAVAALLGQTEAFSIEPAEQLLATLLDGQSTQIRPRLLVAFECDSLNWQRYMARGLQIVQWTFAAQPNHPVLLDVIARALDLQAAYAAQEIAEPLVLDWTGPGVFSDCIFNYLWVQYGIQPEQVRLGDKNAVQAGDVLFYRDSAFRSLWPHPAVWGVVHHGYKGRWRDGADVTPEDG